MTKLEDLTVQNIVSNRTPYPPHTLYTYILYLYSHWEVGRERSRIREKVTVHKVGRKCHHAVYELWWTPAAKSHYRVHFPLVSIQLISPWVGDYWHLLEDHSAVLDHRDILRGLDEPLQASQGEDHLLTCNTENDERERWYQAFFLSSYLGPHPPLSLLYREYRKTKRGQKGEAVRCCCFSWRDGTQKRRHKKTGGGAFYIFPSSILVGFIYKNSRCTHVYVVF